MSKVVSEIEGRLKEALIVGNESKNLVPENWVWIKLGGNYAFCLDRYRKAVNATERAKRNGEISYYGATGQAGWIDSYLTDEELVILGVDGAPFLDPFKQKAYMISGKAWVNNHAHILKSNFGSVGNKCLVHYLNQFDFTNYVNGTTRLKLTQRQMNNIPIPLPPVAELKRIVEKLEFLLSKIAEAEQLIKEAKNSFELRRAAILDKAFRGELTRKWRVDNKPILSAKDRLEAIKKDRFTITESKRETVEIEGMFEDLNIDESINDNDWLYLKANMFCHNITCGNTPSADLSSEGEIPFLKVYNIVDNNIAFSYKPQYIPKDVHEEKLKKSILKPDDVIMNIVGPPFKKIALIPKDYKEMNMNQAIVRFRILEYVMPKYLYYCLQYEKTLEDVINATKGVVGQSNISISQSRNLVIPIPPIEEQKLIVKNLENMIEREETVLEILSNKKMLDTLKQTILSKAFRGDLGTNDPTEENAIELLKEVLQENVK